MKKTYVLLTTLVLSLMVSGFSYAYWSDTLTITGTADTGELSVVFRHPNSSDYGDEYISVTSEIKDSIDAEVKLEGKKLYVTFTDLYPGSYAYADACIFNNGTIPAKLTNMQLVNVNIVDYNATFDETGVDGSIKDNLILKTWVNTAPALPGFTPGTNGVLTIGNNGGYFYNSNLNVELDREASHLFQLIVYLHEDALNPTQGRTVTFEILLDYEQFNEPNVPNDA